MDDINSIKLISVLDNQIIKIAAIIDYISYIVEFDSSLSLSNGRNLMNMNNRKHQQTIDNKSIQGKILSNSK